MPILEYPNVCRLGTRPQTSQHSGFWAFKENKRKWATSLERSIDVNVTKFLAKVRVFEPIPAFLQLQPTAIYNFSAEPLLLKLKHRYPLCVNGKNSIALLIVFAIMMNLLTATHDFNLHVFFNLLFLFLPFHRLSKIRLISYGMKLYLISC